MAALMLLSVWLGGCTDDLEEPGMAPGPVYTITLNTGALSTRAAGDAVNPEHDSENAISRYTIFFFNNAATDTPVFAVDATNRTSVVGTQSITVKVPYGAADKLFAGQTQNCLAYAIVNLPEEIAVDTQALTVNGETASLGNLNALKVRYTKFLDKSQYPENLVMQGSSAAIRLSDDGKTMTGTINLRRLAAKMRLWVNFPEKVYMDAQGHTLTPEDIAALGGDEQFIADGGRICTPVLNEEGSVRAYLYNGAAVARMDGTPLDDSGNRWLDSEEDAFFSMGGDWYRPIIRDLSKKDYPLEGFERSHEIPFYSYPNKWESSSTDEHASSLMMSVLWNVRDSQTSGRSVPSYYYIPLSTRNNLSLESNKYYRIGLNVGMLGNSTPEEPTEIIPLTWEVTEWVQQDINMDLNENKYVVFNENSFVMNNEQVIEIPFSSSHEVEVKECYVTYFKYRDNWGYQQYSDNNTTERNTEFYSRRTNANGYGLTREGLITNTSFGNVYAWEGYYSGSYYVGREHPKTVDPDKNTRKAGMTGDRATAWDLYESRFGMTKMYDCRVENNRLIFNHPLVRWQEYNANGNAFGVGEAGIPDHFAPVLNNNKTGFKDAYSPYHITIIVGLKDDEDNGLTHLRQTIHIIQYPAMYIEVSHNDGTRNINEMNPNVFVNNDDNSGNGANGAYGGRNVMGGNFSLKGNFNPNMYVIHTTQLSEDNDKLFKLGDPRVLNSDIVLGYTGNNPNRWGRPNNTNNNTVNSGYMRAGLKMYNGNGSATQYLTYYYPTDATTGTGSKQDFIAPTFRIASSFGKTYPINKATALNRCASYQEAGRPAGRWRFPTAAEFTYMITLSGEGIIPALFTENQYYWSATGAVMVNAQGVVTENTNPNNNSTYGIRCVYDEWYWVNNNGQEDLAPNATTFYWGDKPKDNPQN